MTTIGAIFLVLEPTVYTFVVVFVPTRQCHLCPHIFETHRAFEWFYKERVDRFYT